MDARVEQQIRERAYQIWIEAGMMQGLEHEHWVAAERDVTATLHVAPKVSKRATASKAKPVVAKPATRKTKAKAADAPLVVAKAKVKSAAAATSDARNSMN